MLLLPRPVGVQLVKLPGAGAARLQSAAGPVRRLLQRTRSGVRICCCDACMRRVALPLATEGHPEHKRLTHVLAPPRARGPGSPANRTSAQSYGRRSGCSVSVRTEQCPAGSSRRRSPRPVGPIISRFSRAGSRRAPWPPGPVRSKRSGNGHCVNQSSGDRVTGWLPPCVCVCVRARVRGARVVRERWKLRLRRT